jgi:hypothetical protein
MTFMAAVNFSCVDITATHVDGNTKILVVHGRYYYKRVPNNEYEQLTDQSILLYEH